jgi:hypothetical protein
VWPIQPVYVVRVGQQLDKDSTSVNKRAFNNQLGSIISYGQLRALASLERWRS